jgi:hypothetical protein
MDGMVHSTLVDYIALVCAVVSPENGGRQADGIGVFTLPACSNAFPAPIRLLDGDTGRLEWETLPATIKVETRCTACASQ